MQIHRKQFVISRTPFLPNADWLSELIGKGFHLSRHKDLVFRGGEIGTERRNAKLSWPYIEGDAAMLLGLYYGDGFVTSSPAIAAEVGNSGAEGPRPSRNGMNWIPMPRSRVGAKRLMVDQRLNIATGRVEKRGYFLHPLASFEEAREVLADHLVQEAAKFQKTGRRIILALTAGRDSRTILAAFLAAGVKFEAVTQFIVNRSDVKVAAMLCRDIGIKHSVIGPAGRRTSLDALNAHTLGSYDGHDFDKLFTKNQYRFLRDEDLFVRGGLFEIGRRFYQRKLPSIEDGIGIYRAFHPGGSNPAFASALDQWLEWRMANPIGLDLVDSFYLDQRVGGWLSALEQALDLLPATSVQPLNSSAAFRSLITPSIPERLAGSLQDEVIRSLAPKLLRIPINPAERFASTRRKILNVGRKLRDCVSNFSWCLLTVAAVAADPASI